MIRAMAAGKKTKKESMILGPLLTVLGREIGATVLLEPEWGVVGRITFKNGRHSYFRYNTLDLNPVGASDVAKDKDYAAYFMKALGYPVPESRAFFSPEWAETIRSKLSVDAARTYAAKKGFPLIVKPNSGSQGFGVYLARDMRTFDSALKHVFRNDKVALVQELLTGRDYRIVVLDGEIISAYERIALNVIGDGRSTVLQLLKKKQRGFLLSKRDTQIKFEDPRIRAKLKSQKMTYRSVPGKGTTVYLLDNANLSTGGDAVDMTARIHPGFKKIAASITKDMGLRLCGVDLMIDGTIEEKPDRYCVIEINAGPGLDHYVKSGTEQAAIVENMYRKVLRSLEKKHS